MTDTTWAAKVLDGVRRCHTPEGTYLHKDDALAAISRMGAGDDLVAQATGVLTNLQTHGNIDDTVSGAVDTIIALVARLFAMKASIAALTAQNREMALDVLASSGQAQEAYDAQIAAEAEAAALRERVAKLVEAAEGLSAILDKHETKGPLPDVAMMLCWLAAQNIRAVLRGNILEKPE